MGQKNFRFNELKNELYGDRVYVTNKWTENYGKLSQYADFEAYNSCIREAFNMVDYVMGNTLYKFRTKAKATEVVVLGMRNGREIKGYRYDGICDVINYSEAYNFYGKAMILRKIGYKIPKKLEDVRELRNFTIHNTHTIVGQVSDQLLSYENVLEALRALGETLNVLGLLRKQDILPEYEKMRVKPGDIIGRAKEYRVDAFIAEGGMSRVYSGVHTRLDRRVAIKELKPYTYSPEQIRNEKQFLVQLEHPQIPQIYDIFDQNGTFYIVMDYIDGVGLSRYVEQNQPDVDERLAIAVQICKVLRYIHTECGMIYADLKPDNVMVDRSGRVLIIDFGISKLMGPGAEADAYSLFYSSPEQMNGRALDQRTDIYSMGSMLQYLFGYNGEDGQIHYTELLGDYLPEMEKLCSICKRENPEERFSTIAEVETHLRRIKQDILVQPKKKRKKRRRFILIGAAAFVLLVFLGVMFYFNGIYPAGVCHFMGKPEISATERGVEITLSVVNRGESMAENEVPWKAVVDIKTKDGRFFRMNVPLRLDQHLEENEILRDQKYIVPWEDVGIPQNEIERVTGDVR